MDAFTRCTDHGLMRCAICAPKAPIPGIHEVLATPAAPVLNGWSPEDALDTPPPGTTVVPVLVQLDDQAREAIERQKEIQEKRHEPIEILPLNTASTRIEVQGTTGETPIMHAAREYSTSQVKVENETRRVELAEAELKNAQRSLQGFMDDRDMKKSVLQKLVAS